MPHQHFNTYISVHPLTQITLFWGHFKYLNFSLEDDLQLFSWSEWSGGAPYTYHRYPEWHNTWIKGNILFKYLCAGLYSQTWKATKGRLCETLGGNWSLSIFFLARACAVPAVGVRAVDCWQWRSGHCFHPSFPFFPVFSSIATFSHRRSARIKKLI